MASGLQQERRTVPWQVVLIFLLLIYVIGPMAVFYGLRALGAGMGPALLAGGAIPVAALVHRVACGGKIDGADLFALGTLAVSGLLSFLNGDPRFLLLKDSLSGVVSGGWVLLTLVFARPLAFQIGCQLGAEGREEAWRDSPVFRRGVRTITALWGGGLLLDAALSALLVYTLPLELVPLMRLSGLLFLAAAVAVGVVYARRYRRRYGHHLVIPDSGRVVLDY